MKTHVLHQRLTDAAAKLDGKEAALMRAKWKNWWYRQHGKRLAAKRAAEQQGVGK